MAKEKKTLLSWLTGDGAAETDYSFDDLESGSSFSSGKKGSLSKRINSTENAAAPVVQEEPEEGELSVDVYQTPSHIVIKAMIAGVKPEDLDISITRDMVTIRGKRERHTEGGNGEYFFEELYWGAFSRTIVLPQEVDIEDAEAAEKHGLLIIRLPKLDKGRQAKLKVKSS